MEKLPELLAPAGTPDALRAAVAAGADAVYFGAPSYNARMGARNFGIEEIKDAVALCRAHGVSVHITLNTQIYDRELCDALRTAEALYAAGVDALIVADLGLARLCREYFPDLPLHASTQCSGHSARDAEYLSRIGFSRMVCARELSADDIAELVRKSPIETEMFVHGAVCVSVSGQCLYSSLVGGRSGNRGECAQPCRLPYKTGGRGSEYPLSTKDMCLAGHIREILSLGVASLKIEGRMKSPGYVYTVTSLYRRLLDEKRDAEEKEISKLAAAFSRSGFTDAYFRGSVKKDSNRMLGVRTDEDKERSRALETPPEPSRVPIEALEASFMPGEPSMLSLTAAGRHVTVAGDVPEAARTRPLTEDAARQLLCRFGGTPFEVTEATRVKIEIHEGIMLPASSVNALRRLAVSALTSPSGRERRLPEVPVPERRVLPEAEGAPLKLNTAEFASAHKIGLREREFFDMIYVPLSAFDGDADGFVMPPFITDAEERACREQIEAAVSKGAKCCILSGAGQHRLVYGTGLAVTAGLRYNVCNTESALAAKDAGAELVTVSPEASAAQIRDIARRVPSSVVVYGRLPLMLTERCIIRAASGVCSCGGGSAVLTDRRGVEFPMVRTERCGTVIYNSVPTYMADRQDILAVLSCRAHHFIFTTENEDRIEFVIDAYKNGLPADFPVRRIK